MPERNPDHATVTYDADVLKVGGIALTQFPDYKEDDYIKIPVGWPALAKLTLSSRPNAIELPAVAAVVFRQNEPIVANPVAAIELSEKTLDLHAAPIITEGTINGRTRACSYRVRSGHMGAPNEPLAMIGTVIAAGTDRPSVGIEIFGGPDSDIERIITEIANELCRDL